MKAKLIFAIALAAQVSMAGIRVIHGGGGFAEMQALSVFDQLQNLVAPCTEQPGLCKLTDDQFRFLKEALGSGAIRTASARLDFSSSLTSDLFQFDAQDEKRMTLPSRQLYKLEGHPLPFDEIAAHVFAAWMMHPTITQLRQQNFMNHASLLEMGRNIFQSIKLEEQSLDLEMARLRVLNLTSSSTGRREVWIGLETENGTQNLTDSVLNQLPCRDSSRRGLIDLQGLHLENQLIHARLAWRCGEDIFQGKLVGRLNSQSHELTVYLLGVSNSACGDLLEQRPK